MKKTYQKPMLFIEHFTLSQSIAACYDGSTGSTIGQPSHADSSTCGWNIGGGLIVFVSEPICNEIMEDGEYDGICYNNPTPGATIFAS